jgi:hypothetical protein
LDTTEIKSNAMTDEYYPTQVAVALALIGEHEQAMDWIEQAVSWGFTNYRWLGEFNRFFEPLRIYPRFRTLMEKARKKQEAFKF